MKCFGARKVNKTEIITWSSVVDFSPKVALDFDKTICILATFCKFFDISNVFILKWILEL